ncbi:MAG: hypothetical protein HY884_03445 [Deltaproteobacteria bacterium]|nr:hypothetical protein [Deltaproteobacteria bacterium]
MPEDISISVIAVELPDGTYRADCPDLGLSATGKNQDSALDGLKEAISKYVEGKGRAEIQLNAVKCMKIKIQVG